MKHPVFSTTRRVQFAETDMAGIVHFANFFRYLEEAEHEFFRSLGERIMHKQDDGTLLSWPRVTAACSYDAPAFHDDILDMRLVELQIGTRSLILRWEVWRDEVRLCQGEMKTVCCRFRPGERPAGMDIPPELREKLEAVQ